MKIPDEAKRVLLELMADGSTAAKACRQIGITFGVVSRWRREDDDFRAAYKTAQESLAHRIAEESVDLVDSVSLDDPKLAMASVALAREQAKSRQWLAARLLPEQYGEKLQATGEVRHSVVMLPALTPLPPRPATAMITESEPAPDGEGRLLAGEGGRG